VTGSEPLQGKRIGIIGAGVMGAALSRGLIQASAAPAGCIVLSDPHAGHLSALRESLGVSTTPSNAEVARQSDIVVLAVKPQTIPPVLVEIGDWMRADQLLISIAAGVRIASIEDSLDAPVPVIRAMPNTAAQVNLAATAYCRGTHVDDSHMACAGAIFRSIGETVEVDERMMDAVTALSGSGPAYVYLMIEALVDGGVKVGLPRDLAHQLAAQTVFGAARMVQVTGRHPAELKDMVATPSGTTITALAALEHSGFRAALIDAVERAAQRAAELGQ